MELLYAEWLYDTNEWEPGKCSVLLREQLSEFDPNVKVTESDIGMGADWPVVIAEIFKDTDWNSLITYAGVSGLFLLGDTIKKNLDAWKSIIDSFLKLIKKYSPTRIDINGVILLVLNKLIEKNVDISRIELTVQDYPFYEISWGKLSIDKRPDSLYVVTVDDGSSLHIFGIKSKGTVEFEHVYEKDFMRF